MKILFLQKVDNARGGVINVNLGLMNFFLKSGHEVTVISIRHGYTWETIHYPDEVRQIVINTTKIWGCPLLSEVLELIKKGHLIQGGKMLLDRFNYRREIHCDYLHCQQEIRNNCPDIIINSHYEVLDGVPKEYLSRTIMHFHTNYDQVKNNRSYMRTFQKYNDQLACFVWLSRKTCERAVADGFVKSRYIYNALSFTSDQSADIKNKKIVFVGRLAREKRVWLAIQHFLELSEEKDYQDWCFEIYGDGDEVNQVKDMIRENPNIVYHGRSDNVKEVFLSSSLMIMTSSFEGMPLVVLEANACGVPVIAYDFGESSEEVILQNKTGILVKEGDRDEFKKQLKKLMSDTKYREQLAINAKVFAKSFSIEEIGPQWLILFEKITKKCLSKQ